MELDTRQMDALRQSAAHDRGLASSLPEDAVVADTLRKTAEIKDEICDKRAHPSRD
jgi:hypothetical protein